MSSSARRLALLFAAFVALCLGAPILASAATIRYAAPTGGTAPCLETSPCSLENALSNAEGLANGDTVLLAPGTYHPAGQLNVFRVSVTVAGEPGQPAPLIEAAGERGLFFSNVGTVRDLRIHSTMATLYGLTMIGAGSVIERVESTGAAARACAVGAVVMRDTLCSATRGPGSGEGVEMSVSGPLPSLTEANLFNVTAIGGFAGMTVTANEHSSVTLNATNTISSGETTDVFAGSFATTAPVHVNLSHSNFEAIQAEGAEAHVTSSTVAANQTAAPLFVNFAAGDYREQEGSPTRLAGDLAAVTPGELDLAGNPRTTNCAGTVGVDIGAYQFECPPPVSPTPPVGTGTPGPPPAPVVLSLSNLKLNPSRFAVSGKGKKGTTISFTLSTAASVKLEVLTKKMVKGKKKTVTLGALPLVSGKAGTDRVKFKGKLKGESEPLGPGKYTLRATATAGGKSARPLSAGFEVRIP